MLSTEMIPAPRKPTEISLCQPLAPLSMTVKRVLRGECDPSDLEETRAVLLELARRKSGKLPPEVLVEQALLVTEGTDWPTRRAALEALLRRLGFAARDELTIVARPARRRILGRYQLARRYDGNQGKGKARVVRPYHTELCSVSPLVGSCDCPDFARGSLGLCKHLLVVVQDVLSRPTDRLAALDEQHASRLRRATLRWNPVRAWTGPGDRLLGLRLEGDRASVSIARHGGASRRTTSLWLPDGRPNPSRLQSLEQRASWLRALAKALDQEELDAESGAGAVVQAELTIAERKLSARGELKTILPHLKTLKRKLFPYQREGVQRFLELRRLLLADDMGLGKTTEAIAACHALREAGVLKRGLLIVPAALKSQWVREWQATTTRVPILAVEGRPDERSEVYSKTKDGFLVIGYEQLLRDLPLVHRFAPELVILDEAQRIKNWATKSSTYVMTLKPEWRLVLTGTPMENRLDELATVLDWVDDVALTPKWRLAPWHTTWQGDGSRGRIGARNLDTLRERLAPCMLRRIRREVLAQLPPRTDQRVPVEITDIQRDAHDSFNQPIAQLIRISKQRPLRQEEFLRLMSLLTQQRIVSNGMAQYTFDDVWPNYSRLKPDESLLSGMSSPKLLELRRLLAELVLDQDRKVVVFSQWRNMLRLAEWATRDLLDQYGLRSVFFTGAEKQELRTRNVIDFHDDRATRVMFLTDAGGVGLNLQKAASACINLELPWNPAVLEQRIGRIYRLGQDQPINVFNLVAERCIESRIAELVSDKRALFSGLFDGDCDEVRFEGAAGFLSQVRRLIEPVEVPDLTIPDAIASESLDLVSDAAQEVVEFASAPGPDSIQPETLAALKDVIEEGEQRHADKPPTMNESPEEPHVIAMPEGSGESSVAALFQGVRVTRTPEGGMRLDAEPAAACALATLLEGLAGLLRSAGQV